MRKKRVYIAGPMTGVKDYNRDDFNLAEKSLSEKGCDVINPHAIFGRLAGVIASKEEVIADFNEYPMGPYAVAMVEMELALLRSCDAIYLLPGWPESIGTRRELKEAIENGLQIIIGGEHEKS